MTLYMLGNFSWFCYCLLTFFEIKFFQKFFQKHFQIIKQFGSRSGRSKLLGLICIQTVDTLVVFLKEFFKKVDFEKKMQTTKKHAKLPSRQRINPVVKWAISSFNISMWGVCMQSSPNTPHYNTDLNTTQSCCCSQIFSQWNFTMEL